MTSRVSDFTPPKRGATMPGSLEPWLKSVTVAFGVGMIVFFLPILVLLPFRIKTSPALEALLRWGPGGSEQYEEMIASIYVVWGIFMVRASADPWANALFLDFTAYANIAHLGLMTLMAVVNKGDRIHLVGDVLGSWLLLGPFLYVWSSVKRDHKPVLRR
ncbi:hypothetical protein BBO_09528 [Beauveria brongniartii RCEF 3172]|uniref:Uncharacterized protein n=1 Tax=Beauveria brongniartii RCEF 3172 TaxID=1081107 RepID=A0A168D314_9HYPO|nr:hypothetical protein BBO_09528 [Beauveria brongniartii RCEF 3172]